MGSTAKERLDGAECLLSMQPEGGRHKSYSHRLRFYPVCVGEMYTGFKFQLSVDQFLSIGLYEQLVIKLLGS
jgi:hypothetical protein